MALDVVRTADRRDPPADGPGRRDLVDRPRGDPPCERSRRDPRKDRGEDTSRARLAIGVARRASTGVTGGRRPARKWPPASDLDSLPRWNARRRAGHDAG